MTNREKISYLQRYSTLMKIFDHKWEKLEQLRAAQGKITASYGPKVGAGGSIFNNREADLIIKIVDLRDDALQTLDQALDAHDEICKVINQLDPDELPHEVCAMRYLNGWSWAEIARRLEYCPCYCHRLHRQALAQLEVVIP